MDAESDVCEERSVSISHIMIEAAIRYRIIVPAIIPFVVIVVLFSGSRRYDWRQVAPNKKPTPTAGGWLWLTTEPSCLRFTECCRQEGSNSSNRTMVPFIVLQDPDWKLLNKAVAAYERELHRALEGLSRQLQLALATEQDMMLLPHQRTKSNRHRHDKLPSVHFRQRIERLSALYQDNARLFQHTIVKPFPTVKTLPSSSEYAQQRYTTMTQASNRPKADDTSFLLQDTHRRQFEDWGYDSIYQTTAHLVRDWSANGEPIRRSIYPWFQEQLKLHHHEQQPSILVPGAGLGRLAWELAANGSYRVHAVELSLTLAAAAHFCLAARQPVTLHPYSCDHFTNEVDSQQRYEEIQVPDVLASERRLLGHLSFTIGDFLEVSAAASDNKGYDAVVTCFFLDTASNVYEYISAIWEALKLGGLWLNVGPLQWHYNSQLKLAANELRDLLTAFGFSIVTWSIDSKPLEYRNEMHVRSGEASTVREEQRQNPRSTHYDAYCPLRFVVRRDER